MTINYANIFNEFASEVRQGLPYCQILNAPNLPQAQLDKIKPAHGVFISKENAEIAGLITEGMQEHENAFRDGEDITAGFILENFRFAVLYVTPLVVQSEGQIVGFYFASSGNGLSDAGKLVAQNPEAYHSRSWWLIAPLNKENQVISSTPIKLSLRGAVGAALAQERKQNIQELEVEFFKKAGKPRQNLSNKAHSYFAMDWSLSPYKTAGKAPYEFVSRRLGITPALEEIEAYRYGSGKDSRKVTIVPESLENLLIVPSSPTGEIISQWYEEYQESFFKKIKSIGAPPVPAEEIAQDISIDADLSASLANAQAALGMDVENMPF